MTVAISLEPLFAFLASSAVWRFRVGRSGSSVDGGLLAVVEPVSAVVPAAGGVLSGVRRFMVGRSGSSAGVELLLVVGAGSAVVLDAVSELRRFMVGRSGSVDDVLVVLDEVVASGLFVVCAGAGLL